MRLAYDDDDLDELIAARFPETRDDSDATADPALPEDDDDLEKINSTFRLRQPEPEYPRIPRSGWPPRSCPAPRRPSASPATSSTLNSHGIHGIHGAQRPIE